MFRLPLIFVLPVAVLSALGGALLWPTAEHTPALRGMAVAERLGCDACHGPLGTRGVGDPGLPSGRAPAWFREADSLIRDEAELKAWVLDGLPDRLSASGPRGGLVEMPAYRDFVEGQELDDLLVWFKAASGWDPTMPDAAWEGWVVAERLGCFGCHGPGGRGSPRNPGSLTGRIPPWDGVGFAELVRDDEELRAWILDGAPPRLLGNPVARHFLEGQQTKMPAYRAWVTPAELRALVEYVHWLRTP